MGVYVQYGCGDSCPEGWINLDASPTLRLQRLPLVGALFRRGSPVFPPGVQYGDVVKGLPFADNSVDGIYASHVLEHLALTDFALALRHTFRVLKPGGIFRLIVPDLEAHARKYLAMVDRDEPEANSWLMRAAHLGVEQRPRGLQAFARTLFGHSAHLWMWDEGSMSEALRRTGFTAVRRCKFNDSSDVAFHAAENEERFYDMVIDVEECAMEARKPAGAAGASSAEESQR
jgi:SAM-dependent methyltransferase